MPLLPLLLMAFSIGAVAGSVGSLNFFLYGQNIKKTKKNKTKNKKKKKNSLFSFFFSASMYAFLSIWLSSHPSINLSRFRQRASTMIFPVLLLLVHTLTISFPHYSAILYVFKLNARGYSVDRYWIYT